MWNMMCPKLIHLTHRQVDVNRNAQDKQKIEWHDLATSSANKHVIRSWDILGEER